MIGDENAPIESIACNPFNGPGFPGAIEFTTVLQKLLVAPLAKPVIRNANPRNTVLLLINIIIYESAKHASNSNILCFLPSLTANAPAKKLEIKLPTE